MSVTGKKATAKNIKMSPFISWFMKLAVFMISKYVASADIRLSGRGPVRSGLRISGQYKSPDIAKSN